MKAYTSRTRFDETRNFTGVYQQMGRVSLDADWNEQVTISKYDARRRTQDLAHGSPDDGFLITDEHLVDRIAGLSGWAGSGLAPGDQRTIPASLRLARREPEGLPHVLRSQGHVSLRRTLAAPLDLNALPLSPSGQFAAEHLVFSVRFARPPNDDDPTAVAFTLEDADGERATFAASFAQTLPEAWHHERVPVASFSGIDLSRIVAWGIEGLPPRAATWIDALRARDGALRHSADGLNGPDFVIRGGDGSIAGAGRLLIDGVRTYLERDVRYSRQPDLPQPPVLADLPDDGSLAHLVYADVWEQLVTAWDDPFISEPALDGLDTTVRLQLLTQVKVSQNQPTGDPVALPPATGSGRLTTNVAAGKLPDRYPPAPADPCRDRCLFTESASTGEGYTGAHNLHFRVEVLHDDVPVIVWSRDNGSTRVPLSADVGVTDTSLRVSREDALELRAGDLIVISDRRVDRQPEGPRAPVLRAVKGVDPDSETVYLEDQGYHLSTDPATLVAGGPVGQSFATTDRAYLRRWDGADWLIENVRYNLPDGITFRLSGSDWRRGEYWSMTARVETPDGAARGNLEQLTDAPVHGPVHHRVALARITRTADGYQFEDLRPRFLPLTEVRDRLAELVAKPGPTGAFTLIIGDGVHTFGDIDQDIDEGVTADEALQSAVQKLAGSGGGTIYLRSGVYFLEKPVQLSGCSRLRILGDGDASQIRVVGAGGAFTIDGCGMEGTVALERLSLVETPRENIEFGGGDDQADTQLPPLSEEVAPLEPHDLIGTASPSPSFTDTLVTNIAQASFHTKRTFNTVLATLRRLRELQRNNPGRPLEQVPAAAALMTLLRRLPHGVVTIADSRQVTLENLSVASLETEARAAGLFLTGSCTDIRISQCRIRASTAILAMPYGPYISRRFFARNPRSGLYLERLRLDANQLAGTGDAACGIRLAEGTLRRAQIQDNRISGFNVGIALYDRLDLGRRGATAATVDGNRLEHSTGIGIDVRGREVDIADNRIDNADPTGLFQAGIRVNGSNLRIRGCELVLPALGSGSPARSPLAMIAGVVIGDGVDAAEDRGYRGPATVQNVEVANCQIGALDRTYPGIGVLIGGPGPVLGVRVRDCSFHQLGDAAVRTWGHGGKTGRIRVDDNRIEDVAAANVPRTADTRPAIEALSLPIANQLANTGVDTSDAGALLGALLDSTSSDVIGPLDGVLRWVALRTLRSAIVFDQVEEGEIVANRIRGIGADDGTQGNDVRTSAIAAIAGSDIVVEGNHIEHVIARRQTIAPPQQTGQAARPAAFDALAGLDLDLGEEHADRADVHAGTVALRRLILAYGGGSDPDRMRIGRRIYAAMDALVDDLDAFGGRGAEIGAALVSEADEMRSAQGREDHTSAADRVRTTLSRAAAFTAGGDLAQAAWETATQFDLGVVDRTVEPVAKRLQDAAAELTKGLPEERRTALEGAMAEVLGAQAALDAAEDAGAADTQAERSALEQALGAAAGELGTLGEWRDAEYSRSRSPEPGELFGSRQIIARRFAERLDSEAARLAVDADAENQNILDDLQADKDALIDTIRATNVELGNALEADWSALERSVTEEHKTRLKTTLGVISDWTAGGSGTVADTPTAAAEAVERQAEAGNAALIGMVAKHLDSGVGKLLVEPAGVRTKNLKLLQSASGQLQNLVAEDREAADLAGKASAAIRVAAADTQRRAGELAKARAYLAAIGRRAGRLVIRPTPPPVKRPVFERVELRIAALGALVLSLRTLTGSLRTEDLSLFRAHFERLLDSGQIEGRNRALALQAIEDAATTLERSAAGSALETALHSMMRQLDRAAGTMTMPRPPAALAATLVLVRAATLALDSGEDEATRLLRVQGYLRERSSTLSQSTQQALARRSSVTTLSEGIHGVLERLALGERPRVPGLDPPFFDQQLSPADGIFGASSHGRLRIAHNQIQHAVRGITLLGATGHPLVATVPDDGLVLQLAGNRIDGCALGGFDLQPSGAASLTVTDNAIFACAGIGEEGPDIGQSVAHIAGTGDLVVQGNVFQGNGHRHERAVLHEIAVDWRGEAVIRGNTVRHVGGGAGGAGLLLVAEAGAGGLARALTTAPFLGIEPPPRPQPEDAPSTQRPAATLPFLQAALQGTLAVATPSNRMTSGRLVQRISTTRIAPRLLTSARPQRITDLASINARRYLDRELISPTRRILDFVRRRPYYKPAPPPPPPEQRTLHVEGNDIAAYGPALLMIGEESGDLLSTSIVANGLHSEGGTGAAYVRNVDSLVFATNRCQAPETVNVVVVRALTATVSITGNLIAGREPVAPPVAPRPPRPRLPTTPGRVTLNLPLGVDAALSVPIDPARLRGSIESFSGEAQKAFANVLIDRAVEEQAAGEPFLPALEITEEKGGAPEVSAGPPEGGETPSAAPSAAAPRASAMPSTGITALTPSSLRAAELTAYPFSAVLAQATAKYSIAPFTGSQEPAMVLKYIQDNDLGSRDVEAVFRGTLLKPFASEAERQAFKNKVQAYRIEKKAKELQSRKPAEVAIERAEAASVFSRVATAGETQVGALATMSKLFTAQGFSANRTTAEIRALLESNEGNATKALGKLQKDIFASEDATPPARKAIEDIGLIEKVLSDELFTGREAIEEPEEEEPEPPPPDPYAHSLVVLGGAAVAAVGNSTTAGTLVQDAQESVELNI